MASSDELPEELKKIEDDASCSFPNLREAATRSSKKVTQIEASIEKEFEELETKGIDTSGIGLIVTGSIARKEVTEGSDCDYLLVSDSTPSHESVVYSLNAVDTVLQELDLLKPGSQGVFGEFVTASELFIRIGLERDSNPNMTRRLSILLESTVFIDKAVRNTVLDRIIERYCARYSPRFRKKDDEKVKVPRFLVNDLIRYWRTVAVDFEAKRWRSPKAGWGLRYAKLLSTRKIMFAGSLASYLAVSQNCRKLQISLASYIGTLTSRSSFRSITRLV